MQSLFTLTSAESKRLLAKAVVALPEVQRAKEEGYLVISRGSTNAFIIEELLGGQMEKERYTAGQIVKGVLCVLDAELRLKPVTLHKGEVLDAEPGAVLDQLTPDDLLLKGANAIDPFGNVGVVMAGPTGGTMGQFYMALKARGVPTLYTVGLEKLIPSVEEAARYGGTALLGRSIGCRAGLACIADGRVMTEVEAIDTLFGLQAVPFASGGWGGAEGALTLIVEGEEEEVNRCLDLIEAIKGEPPLPAAKGPCKTCSAPCNFAGKTLKALPPYLR
jgi:hypothetical protein